MRNVRPYLAPVIINFFISIVCRGETSAPLCQMPDEYPYSIVSTSRGIHANRANNNRIPCDGPGQGVQKAYLGLPKKMIFQPISFSADGKKVYATASQTTGDCNAFSMDMATGSSSCIGEFDPSVGWGTAEVDSSGNFYFIEQVSSVDSSGNSVPNYRIHSRKADLQTPVFPGEYIQVSGHPAPAGIHFSKSGRIASLTLDGILQLFERSTGAKTSEINFPLVYGLQPVHQEPKSSGTAMADLFSKYLQLQFRQVFGTNPFTDAYSIGGGTFYTSQTLAVGPNGQIFGELESVLGSSVVAADENSFGVVTPRWIAPLPGSASDTSPSVSPDGKYVVVADGQAHVYAIDVDKCNNNTDLLPSPSECQYDAMFTLTGTPMGNLTTDELGRAYVWNTTFDKNEPDIIVLQMGGGSLKPILSFNLARNGENPQWSSAITVLNNMIIGTLTTPTTSGLKQELVALDRFDDGSRSGIDPILWRAKTDDDSVNTVVIGPDGAIYVPNYGLFDLLMPGQTQWQGGIDKFTPLPSTAPRRRLKGA